MTVSTSTSTTRTIDLPGGLAVTIQEFGQNTEGTGVLMLHGGAGPRSMAGFATDMSQHAYVVVPTHPGFDGTPRPESTDTVADLATAYLDLLDALDLRGIMVAGSSVGGWIAAEMALRDNAARISCLTLLASTGIAPEPPLQLANPAELGPVRTGELAFHNPQLRRTRPCSARSSWPCWPPTSALWPCTRATRSAATRSCAGACTGSPSRCW